MGATGIGYADGGGLTPRALLLVVVVVALGCGERRPATAPLTLWAMGREGEVVEQMMPTFEARHPGLRVKVQRIPWSAAHEKLLTAHVGHATPDLAQLGNTWVPELVTLDALLPLDSLQRGDLVFWKGHVGIMTDGFMLLHANAHHMAVVIEPLKGAVDRIARTTSSRIVAIKRPASKVA